jgi:hypothetical protein
MLAFGVFYQGRDLAELSICVGDKGQQRDKLLVWGLVGGMASLHGFLDDMQHAGCT